jgi:cytochrome c-type biogenesis protein CcmH/NrfF
MQFLSTQAKRLRLIAAVFLGMVVLLGAGDDAARIDRIGHQMMCVCGCNQVLLECNHVGCPYSSRMREQLVAAVTRGESDTSVLQWFIQTYGTIVLTVPTHHGFNRIAWIMPYLVLIAGITLVVLVVWAWKKRPVALPAGVPGVLRGDELERFREQARRETEV